MVVAEIGLPVATYTKFLTSLKSATNLL